MLRNVALGITSVAVLGCSSPTEPDLVGVWGGEDVSMVLTAAGGTLQYACGNGTIDAGWRLTDDGEFSAEGEHFFGGGPLPAEGRPPHAAEYHGTLRSDVLTFHVTVVAVAGPLGPFEMRRNGPQVTEICF